MTYQEEIEKMQEYVKETYDGLLDQLDSLLQTVEIFNETHSDRVLELYQDVLEALIDFSANPTVKKKKSKAK